MQEHATLVRSVIKPMEQEIAALKRKIEVRGIFGFALTRI